MASAAGFVGLLLLCVGAARVSAKYNFFSHMLNHPKNPHNLFQAYFENLLPQYDGTMNPIDETPTAEEECPQVQTIRAMIELHWIFNDHNLDGVLDTPDVLWDLTVYNRPEGDQCFIKLDEAQEHAMCLYSYPSDYALDFVAEPDRDGDGEWNWFDAAQRSFNATKTNFLRGDYNRIQGFCDNNNNNSTICALLASEPVPDFMAD